MQTQLKMQRTAAPAPRQVAHRLPVRVAAVQQQQQGTQTSTGGKATEEIYLGFPKNDYAPRAGRKGRVIKDDPRKYPGREDLGFFLGAVGGWAGGEAGLWQLREQYQAEQAKNSGKPSAPKPLAPSSPLSGSPQKKNKWGVRSSTAKDPIYVGFGKDELDLRKSGAQGRVIYDDAYKYPQKEDLGFFLGAVGGFAGGEAVLKEFAATGELKLRKPGEPLVSRQFSPLTLAFLLITVVAGGGILLTTALDLGETGVAGIEQAPVDDTTKELLLAGLLTLGGTGLILAARGVVKVIQERLEASVENARETAQGVVVSTAFLAAVFVVARLILESQ